MIEEFVASFEGLRLTAYQDSVGVWTIGYGDTENVHPGMVITKETADSLLQEKVTQLSEEISKRSKPLTENQLCALVDFAYNLGLNALLNSTLWKLLQSNAPAEQVAAEFIKWCHAGSKVLPGLLNRRKQEQQLFLKGL